MVGDGAPTPASERIAQLGNAIRTARRLLPPARLLWVILALLGVNGVLFLGSGIGIASLLVLPVFAVIVDLAFQRYRFKRLRFPDAAIVTGLFLALLFPPVVPLVGAAAATLGAVGLRHLLRTRGRPWFNPAATGLVLGAIAFGLAPAWWGAVNENLVLVGGAILFLWNLPRWRLPIAFLGAFAGFTTLGRVVYTLGSGSIVSAHVFALAVADPTLLFFGLLMVPEPRTAPADPRLGWLYGVIVAASAAFLPLLFPTLALPLALLVGNGVMVAVRLRSWAHRRSEGEPTLAGARRRSAPKRESHAGGGWTVPRRISAGIGLGIVMLILASTMQSASSGIPIVSTSPGGTLGGGSTGNTTACQHDNPTIPAGTLSSLHKTLGPSVILSYTAATGIVTFYDPVNQVTVTETDLYEDFGYAEFNSDDGTVPGCAA
ncbi:MAG: RnfABCDGE type electron transport complex subunit D [Thermoplasmata archaeon]|nr:RnfABCDGE type electron transport complex subunit D [Thermoplasmata archaeon]